MHKDLDAYPLLGEIIGTYRVGSQHHAGPVYDIISSVIQAAGYQLSTISYDGKPRTIGPEDSVDVYTEPPLRDAELARSIGATIQERLVEFSNVDLTVPAVTFTIPEE